MLTQVHAYAVTGLAEGRSYLAGLDPFDLQHEKVLPADTFLTTPNLSLYSLDEVPRRIRADPARS